MDGERIFNYLLIATNFALHKVNNENFISNSNGLKSSHALFSLQLLARLPL
jgi:hypothetical protein